MADDTDVMFRIGVMDHPASKAALEALAKNVDAAQARMTAGVDGIGKTAGRASSLVESLTAKLDEMAKHSANTMRGAVPPSVVAQSQGYRGSVSMSTQPQPYQQQQRGTVPSGVMPSIPATSVVPDSVVRETKRHTDEINSYLDDVQAKLDKMIDDSIHTVPIASKVAPRSPSSDSVPDEVRRTSKSHSDDVSAFLDGVQAKLDNWELSHAETYAAMAKDLDGYLAKNGSTTDQIGANLRIGESYLNRYRDSAGKMAIEARTSFIEGATYVAGMIKGMATLGLVSEENAQKFMQSYAAIQGVFEIVANGARAYNSVTRGMIQAREAQQMMTKAMTVSAAIETAQIGYVRTYHAALVQEAAAANTAAAANGRLAASRTAAGAASAASSAGSGIVEGLGGLGGLGRMARFGGMAGRVASIGLRATPIAAAIGAGATIGYQNATGSSSRDDSSVMGSTMKTYAWLLRLTGLFEKLDSPANKLIDSVSEFMGSITNMTGLFDSAQIPGMANGSLILDARGLAASQAGVERGQKSLDKNRIDNAAKLATQDAEREAEREKERMRFRNSVDMNRSRYESQTSRFGFQDNVGDRNFERQQFMNRLRMRPIQNEGVQAMAQVAELTARSTHMRSRPSEADAQLKGETKVYADAVSGYAKAKAELDKTLSFAGSTEKDRENAMKNAVVYQEEMIRSMTKQAQLARASGAERLQIEREIQSAAMQAIDQQQAKLEALNDRRKSAMSAFVNMDAIERSMATKALDKARAGGGGALSKMEAELLGRIGTEETNRFVDQSTEAKAKQLGFDNSFGQSIDMTRRQIEGTKQQLEAQLQASFDVSMKVEADTDMVVDAILPQVEQAMREMSQAIERSVDEKLRDQLLEIQTQRTRDNNMLRRN
ncbi:MAG: hypothetical protein ACK506_19000 [Pirellula sp.]